MNPEIRTCTTSSWKIMSHESLYGNKNLKKKDIEGDIVVQKDKT